MKVMRLATPALFAVLASLSLCAQTQLTVEQLVSFVRSSIQLEHSDKRIADFLKKVRLSEKLEDRVIDELVAAGAGAKTFEALKGLQAQTASLPEAQRPSAAKAKPSLPPPPPEEQQRLLDTVREYAKNYTGTLPDFLCLQVTRRYYDPSGLEFWQKQDQITARLSYVDDREEYKVILVDDTPTNASMDSLDGATSTGEFGSMLREIFEAGSHASFEWSRWGTLRGRRAHVISYHVPKVGSKWSISWQKRVQITPGYRGLIYVDRNTGMILRLTLEAVDIPPSFPIQEASSVLDYDFTPIAEREYLLPLKAMVRMREGKLLVKNEVEFRNYRKFSADAVITFDATLETPAPLPEDKETPPRQ